MRAKFDDHLPVYRQAEIYAREGLTLQTKAVGFHGHGQIGRGEILPTHLLGRARRMEQDRLRQLMPGFDRADECARMTPRLKPSGVLVSILRPMRVVDAEIGLAYATKAQMSFTEKPLKKRTLPRSPTCRASAS